MLVTGNPHQDTSAPYRTADIPPIDSLRPGNRQTIPEPRHPAPGTFGSAAGRTSDYAGDRSLMPMKRWAGGWHPRNDPLVGARAASNVLMRWNLGAGSSSESPAMTPVALLGSWLWRTRIPATPNGTPELCFVPWASPIQRSGPSSGDVAAVQRE